MFDLAGMRFHTVSQLRDYVYKKVLHKSRLDHPLHGKASRVIAELFSYHPEAAAKSGVGVKHFCVGKHESGARAFCIVRGDGTSESFSVKKCIAAYQQSAPVTSPAQHQNPRRAPKKQAAVSAPASHRKRPTFRQQILGFLCEGPKQRKEIIRHFYGGSATATQTKSVGNKLSDMVRKGEIVRVKTGVYATSDGKGLSPGKIDQTSLRTGIHTALQDGEKRRSELITEVLGAPSIPKHIVHLQNMLKRLCDTGEIVKVRHGVYAAIGTAAEANDTDIEPRLRRLAAHLATCQSELQELQSLIQQKK